MTDWVAIFKDIDGGMTQVQAATKHGIHPKSISRKKKEMIDAKASEIRIKNLLKRKEAAAKLKEIGNMKGNTGNKRVTLPPIKMKFKGAHAAWLGLYPSMIKRFTRFGYGNFVDFTEVVNDYFNQLKKEVDKK